MKKTFFLSLIILLLIGLLMVYSASSIWAEYKMGSKYYYLIRQTIFFAIAILIFFITSRIDYHYYKKYSNDMILPK